MLLSFAIALMSAGCGATAPVEIPAAIETLFVTGALSPDVSGSYDQVGTSDGEPVYQRTELVGGKQYSIYRLSYPDGSGNLQQGWFLSTQSGALPASPDPFWSLASATLTGDLAPKQGGSGLAHVKKNQTPAETACTYTYSAWNACQADGTQTREVSSVSPAGCTGTPVVTQTCTYVPTPTPTPTPTPPPPPPTPIACTYTYSAWSTCQPDGTQTRTVNSASPTGCTGTPVLTQACTYVAPPPPPTSLAFPPLVTMVKSSPPALAEPALGASATYSDLGTTVTHVANTPHLYAKTSPWNSDESLAMTVDGSIYDGQTYAYLRSSVTSVFPNEHRSWSSTDPRYIYGAHFQNKQWIRVDATSPGNNVVLKTYVASDVGLSSLSSVSFGEYEGNIDDNDTGVTLVANGVRPFLVNPKTGGVRCLVTSGGGYGNSVSDATISHDGSTILVNWVGYGVDAYSAATCSWMRQLTTRNSHYDACVSSAGEQVVAQFTDSGLRMTRISDGTQTDAYTADGWVPGHVSCRNTKRPGWAYVSLYNETCDSSLQSMRAFHRIFAVKLDGSQGVQNFAWDHQRCPAAYEDMTMAAPSPLGNRVWWKSIWDGTSSGIHSFVARQ